MKPYIVTLLQSIRAEGEKRFVAKNQQNDPKLSQDRVANNASNPSIGPNGKEPFEGLGVKELEGAKTLRGSHLPGVDRDMYEAMEFTKRKAEKGETCDSCKNEIHGKHAFVNEGESYCKHCAKATNEDVSPEMKAQLAKNKENKKFTVTLKHLVTGKPNAATIKANSPEDAMDKADATFPHHEPVAAKRVLPIKEDADLTTQDILDEAMRLTDEQKQKREDIVKGMHGQIAGFKKRYGARWENVMYATATKIAIGEQVDLDSDLSNIEEDLVEYAQGHPPIVKKGALHKQEHIKQGVKIGKKRLEALKAHGTKLEKKRANFALNFNKEDVNEDAMGIPSDFEGLGETGAKELVFHAMGTQHLVDHQKPYIANMARRMKKGNYTEEKGKKMWGHYADHAAEDYMHEHGGVEEDPRGKHTFPKDVRHEVAAHFEKKHRERMQAGIHEDIEELDYSSLIDDMRMSIIDVRPLIIEFGNGSEREISPKKVNAFLNLYDTLDEDDQNDLVLAISGNYKSFKKELNEHSTYEQHCHKCGGTLDQHESMGSLLNHIDEHKIPREVAREAIHRMSRKEVDKALNRNYPGANSPAVATPVMGISR